MTDEEIIMLLRTIQANDATIKAHGISDNLYGKAAECIEFLKNENDALLTRFAALNKMPCNIGDTVYVLFGACYKCEEYMGDYCSCENRGKDKIFEMKVGSVRFDKDDYYLYEDPIGISSGLSCSGRNYGKTWFLSHKEAEAYLVEQEEKKDAK